MKALICSLYAAAVLASDWQSSDTSDQHKDDNNFDDYRVRFRQDIMSKDEKAFRIVAARTLNKLSSKIQKTTQKPNLISSKQVCRDIIKYFKGFQVGTKVAHSKCNSLKGIVTALPTQACPYYLVQVTISLRQTCGKEIWNSLYLGTNIFSNSQSCKKILKTNVCNCKFIFSFVKKN